jgi:hypothetical protein
MFQLLLCKRFLPNISETPTCDPVCTNENTCSGATCMCGSGTACTGVQMCKNGNCGMYLYLLDI